MGHHGNVSRVSCYSLLCAARSKRKLITKHLDNIPIAAGGAICGTAEIQEAGTTPLKHVGDKYRVLKMRKLMSTNLKHVEDNYLVLKTRRLMSTNPASCG